MAVDVPGQYDFILNGLGYLIAWESEDAYHKIGPNTIAEQTDQSVEEISENKLDGLFWSSQRSWFNGAGQKRLDEPNTSDKEKYLVSKNIDTTDRGQMRLSRRWENHIASPTASTVQTFGISYSQADYLVWASPRTADTEIRLKTVQAWNDTTADDRGAGFGADHEIQGLTSDGEFIYASNVTGANASIRRGTLSQTTTTLTAWHGRGLRDIAFVKERLLGWTTVSGQTAIYEVSTGAAPTETLLKQYSDGWNIRSVSTGQDVFAEVGNVVVWPINAGGDGYLYLWDGTNAPFAGARFPNIELLGAVSYANNKLYLLGRLRSVFDDAGAYDSSDPYDTSGPYDASVGGAPLVRVLWIQVTMKTTDVGVLDWDILHRFDGIPYPRFEVRDREIYFPVSLPATQARGLSSDAGIGSDSYARVIAAFNVSTGGMNFARYWGLSSGSSITAQLWGDTGFTAPSLALLGSALGLVGDDGGTRFENVSAYAPTGELVSSQIDLNIDSNKVFLIGESSFDNLVSGATVTLQYATTAINEDVDPTWTTIGSATSGQNIRQQITSGGNPGVSSVLAHYRIQLAVSSSSILSPVVRKVGFGMEPVIRPRQDHVINIKAYDRMTLRNGQAWPGSRPSDTIQSELEALRTSQSVVDFQEPKPGLGVRAATKVQVKQVDVSKRLEPASGWKTIVTVRLREVPV